MYLYCSNIMLVLVCMQIVMLVGMLMVILEVDQHQIQVPASYLFVMRYPNTNICYIKLFSSLIYPWMNHKVHHCIYNNMFMYLNNLTNFKLPISSGWVVYNMCSSSKIAMVVCSIQDNYNNRCIYHISQHRDYMINLCFSSILSMLFHRNHYSKNNSYELVSSSLCMLIVATAVATTMATS